MIGSLVCVRGLGSNQHRDLGVQSIKVAVAFMISINLFVPSRESVCDVVNLFAPSRELVRDGTNIFATTICDLCNLSRKFQSQIRS